LVPLMTSLPLVPVMMAMTLPLAGNVKPVRLRCGPFGGYVWRNYSTQLGATL
jgi:hypothetical protein